MRTAFGLFFWLLIPLGLVGGPVAAIVFGIEDRPLVRQNVSLTPEIIERGQVLLERYDPRRMKAGEITTVFTSEDELNSALAGGLSGFRAIEGRVSVKHGKLDLDATLELPRSVRWMGRFINLSAAISPSPRGFTASRFRVGQIELPPLLAMPAFQITLEALVGQGGGAHIIGSIRSINILGKTVAIGYRPLPGMGGYRTRAFREARGGGPSAELEYGGLEYGGLAEPGHRVSSGLADNRISSRAEYEAGIVEPMGRELEFGIHASGSRN